MYLTEIENRLANDVTGASRSDLLSRLAQLRADIAAQLAAPLAPADYRRVVARVEGCDAAISVVALLAQRLRKDAGEK
ncbi:EscE/YscE/SsaE family type III secretion system needle protein co-chaperone [Burkholderia sp. WSM2232]|uniref:EscE/YscE/SsaE family type III secretion system needle protein co-chaperone n=1 Tax=Burkholderia sp. WSM2232 TaxID=944436 RepID=UPI0003FF9422|nr:EscE/YscE/SsaE family type III secretion system needle protein co-chaperone [Burkholderia sp. WSM2232]